LFFCLIEHRCLSATSSHGVGGEGSGVGGLRGGVPIKMIHCPDLYFHKQKVIISSGHLWVVEFACKKFFPSSSFLVVSILLLFPLIATGVLDLRISPQIFKKIQNDPGVIFKGFGEDYS
jgi:hypothetical protein